MAYKPRPHDLKGPKPLSYTVPSDPVPIQAFFRSVCGEYITSPIGHLHSTTSARPVSSLPGGAHLSPGGSASSSKDAVFDDILALQIFTHKSFDHGRSPYNEKLADHGRRLIELAVAERLMFGAAGRPAVLPDADAEAVAGAGANVREAYEANESAALWQDAAAAIAEADASLDPASPSPASADSESSQIGDGSTLTAERLDYFTSSERLGNAAATFTEMASFLRWKPRDDANHARSGARRVSADALSALVGALDIRYGEDIARKFVEGKILPVLGITDAPIEDGESIDDGRRR